MRRVRKTIFKRSIAKVRPEAPADRTGQCAGPKQQYEEELQLFIRFFDIQAFCIMAFMMTMGISLRAFHLVPDIFIAVFYTGLGVSLLCAGILFLVQFYLNIKEEK